MHRAAFVGVVVVLAVTAGAVDDGSGRALDALGEAEHRAVAALVEGLAHGAAVVGLQRRHREPDGVNDGVLRLAARRFGDVAGAQAFYPWSQTPPPGIRSEERRFGKWCGSTLRSQGSLC